MEKMLDTETTTKIGELAAKAYIDVYGFEKWNSLSVQQQHDAIMYVLTDICNRLAETRRPATEVTMAQKRGDRKMKKHIVLTHEQASALVCCLLMTTNYYKSERETWEKLATETTEDGTPRHPNAAKNAKFWADAEREIAEFLQIIDAAPLIAEEVTVE